ncbi:MAG: aldehyde ferredoxin oxidoreductase C-terminal domain-containing protein, partial [Chloroflexota bacterium]
ARMGSGLLQALAEAATTCNFVMGPFTEIWGSAEEAIRVFLNAVCGWELTAEDINDIKLRDYYFNRCISLREGYHPSKDDVLPPRAFDEPITDKYGTVWVWDREEYEGEKRRHYEVELKLTEAGLPPREEMKRLGLDFVIPVLDPMNVIG